MARIGRRDVIGWFGAALMLPRMAEAGTLAGAYPRILKFDVTRNGGPLGTVMKRFSVGADGNMQVDVCIDFVVAIAGVALYRYEHRSREIWSDGRLVALDTVTNDDGVDQAVTARAGRDGLQVDGMHGRLVAPPDILPSSYWHPQFVQQEQMLDSQVGRILEITIRPVGAEAIVALGRPVDSMRYAMRGDIDLDIWYDADRVWQKMIFSIDSSFVEYTRVQPEQQDAARFGTPLRDGRRLPDV